MKNVKKISQFIVTMINYFLFYLFWVLVCGCLFIKHTWGNVSLVQLLFFAQTDLSGADSTLIYRAIRDVLCLPIVITVIFYWIIRKIYRPDKPYFPRFRVFLFLTFIFTASCLIPDIESMWLKLLYSELVLIYLLNLKRNFSPFNLMCLNVSGLPIAYFMFGMLNNSYILNSGFSLETTNVYQNEFVAVPNTGLPNKSPRNIILIFGESLESKYVHNDIGDIHDEKAVKFEDFTEGYAQRWTQAALFSAFTGVHIHYLSDFYRYRIYDNINVKRQADREANWLSQVIVNNEVGENFAFNTPHITYLGEIMEKGGYQNLFVQGGELNFSGTRKMLEKHGFKKKNLIDLQNFNEDKDFIKKNKWWGVSDKTTFNRFKQELSRLEPNKPFFAVMFTLGLHSGDNPFASSDKEVISLTIDNFNDFISWFEQQPFYNNTTLIIVADHRRMFDETVPGGGLYNAFFNLPNGDKLNLKRSFNQIDMFPTILEIAGFDLPSHKGGMGTSLLTNQKTFAERFNYNEQQKIFTKIDLFYRSLWE